MNRSDDMSKFTTYAKRMDALAREAFSNYQKAQTKYDEAKRKADEYPQRHGIVTAEYEVKAIKARSDFMQAQDELKRATASFRDKSREVSALRQELEAEIKSAYYADPEQIDEHTLELLKSGILSSEEYSNLMNNAIAKKNHTMGRLIGRYAEEASELASKKYGEPSPQAMELRGVAVAGKSFTGEEYLQAFDVLADVFTRCTNNPAMIKEWDMLTSETVDNF